MGRKSLKDTRQKEILKSFYQVAKMEGLENASIAKVAANLNVNPSLIMYYYKTRDEILVSMVSYILERYMAIYKTDGEINTKEKLINLIENLFSRKWNKLFDDGVFYSCYSLIYRNKSFRKKFKSLHDLLRQQLIHSFTEANKNNITSIEHVEQTAEIVFAIIEGAYYYLGLAENKKEYDQKLDWYKQHVMGIINIRTQIEIN